MGCPVEGLSYRLCQCRLTSIIAQEVRHSGTSSHASSPATFSFRIPSMDIDMEVPAWYVDTKHVNILLGQEIFFDSFKIKFEKDHDMFELVRANK